jgi:hypothetical protein
MSREATAPVDEECSFKPRLVSRRPGSATNTSVPRYEALYRSAEHIEGKRADAAAKADAECSFTPRINRSKIQRNGNVFDNLYKKSQDKARRQKEMAETGGVEADWFSPKVNKPSGKKAVSSVSKRLYSSEKAKSRYQDREDAKVARELEDCTFQPSLTSKRKGSTKVHGAAHDRLYKAALAQRSKAAAAEAARKEAEVAECTFSPAITKRASALRTRTGGKSIGERLHEEATIRQLRLEERANTMDEELTFKPRTNAAPHHFAQRSDDAPRWAALHQEGTTKVHTRNTQAEYNSLDSVTEDELKECTFKPHINPAPSKTFLAFTDFGDGTPARAVALGTSATADPARRSMSPIDMGGTTAAGNELPVDDGRMDAGGDLYV